MKLGIALTLALALPTVAALAGCGSRPADSNGTSTAAVALAQEGDRCGGFVAHPKQCDESENLYCKSTGVPDMPGVCTSCAHFGPLPHIAKVCADGEEHSAHWVARSGSCQIEVCPATAGGCPDVWECPSGQHFDGSICGCAADANGAGSSGSGDDAGNAGDDASAPSGDDGGAGTGNPGDPCVLDSDCASDQCDANSGTCL